MQNETVSHPQKVQLLGRFYAESHNEMHIGLWKAFYLRASLNFLRGASISRRLRRNALRTQLMRPDWTTLLITSLALFTCKLRMCSVTAEIQLNFAKKCRHFWARAKTISASTLFGSAQRRERVQTIRHTQRRTFLDRDFGQAPPQIHRQHLCSGCIERVVLCEQRATTWPTWRAAENWVRFSTEHSH